MSLLTSVVWVVVGVLPSSLMDSSQEKDGYTLVHYCPDVEQLDTHKVS